MFENLQFFLFYKTVSLFSMCNLLLYKYDFMFETLHINPFIQNFYCIFLETHCCRYAMTPPGLAHGNGPPHPALSLFREKENAGLVGVHRFPTTTTMDFISFLLFLCVIYYFKSTSYMSFNLYFVKTCTVCFMPILVKKN